MYFSEDLTPEREGELIDEIAGKIVEYGMEGPAATLLYLFKPFGYIGSQLGFIYLAPFLEFLQIPYGDYLALFMLDARRSRKNFDNIISRVKEIAKKREKVKRTNGSLRSSIFSRLKKLFRF